MLYSSPNHRVFSFDVILFTKSLCFFPWCYTLHQIIAFFPLVLYSSPNHCVFSLDITLFTKSSCFFPWCYTLHQIIVFFPLMLYSSLYFCLPDVVHFTNLVVFWSTFTILLILFISHSLYNSQCCRHSSSIFLNNLHVSQPRTVACTILHVTTPLATTEPLQ